MDYGRPIFILEHKELPAEPCYQIRVNGVDHVRLRTVCIFSALGGFFLKLKVVI